MRKLLSITGILFAVPVKAVLKPNKTSELCAVPVEQNLSQTTSEWDYRPKEAIRRFANLQGARMETADLLTQSGAEDKSDNVRFDDRWLEFETRTFGSVDGVDATAANEPVKPSLSDQERAVSAYD